MASFFDPTNAMGAASQAGNVQSQAALAGIPIQQQAFLQTQQNLNPYAQVGQAALGSQAALAGLGGQDAQQAAVGQIQESPGQKFIRDRQERSLLRNASAIGGLGGGNVLTALQEQASGFAMQDLNNQRQQLGQLSGQGLTAGTNLGTFGATSAGSVADLQQAEAAARASGIIGEQQAEASNFEQVAGFASTLADIFA